MWYEGAKSTACLQICHDEHTRAASGIIIVGSVLTSTTFPAQPRSQLCVPAKEKSQNAEAAHVH